VTRRVSHVQARPADVRPSIPPDSTAAIIPDKETPIENPAITPDGSLLLCANMPGNNVAVFRIDGETGRLTSVGGEVDRDHKTIGRRIHLR